MGISREERAALRAQLEEGPATVSGFIALQLLEELEAMEKERDVLAEMLAMETDADFPYWFGRARQEAKARVELEAGRSER